MALLTIDTNALHDAASAADHAATEVWRLGTDLPGQLAAGAGMSGWESTAMDWGREYDAVAAQLCAALEGLHTAYAGTAHQVRLAAGLYSWTEAAAAGQPPGVHQVPWPALPAAGFPAPPSAVGGRFPLLPEFGQFLADAAGVMWPSGDAEALRQTAAAWLDAADRIRRLAARCLQSAAAALVGLVAADVELLRLHHQDLHACALDIAAGCESLAAGCRMFAAEIEQAHAELVAETRDFALTVAAALGAAALASFVTAGVAALAGGGVAAARAAVAAARFQAVTGWLSGRAGELARAHPVLQARLGGTAARLADLGRRSQLHRVPAMAAAARTTATVQGRVIAVQGRALAWSAATRIRAVAARLPAVLPPGTLSAGRTLAGKYGDRLLGTIASGPETAVAQTVGLAARPHISRAYGTLVASSRQTAGAHRWITGRIDMQKPLPVAAGSATVRVAGRDGRPQPGAGRDTAAHPLAGPAAAQLRSAPGRSGAGISRAWSHAWAQPSSSNKWLRTAAVNPQTTRPLTVKAGPRWMRPARLRTAVYRLSGCSRSATGTRNTWADSLKSMTATGEGSVHQASTGVTMNRLTLNGTSGKVPRMSTPEASSPVSSTASRSAAASGPPSSGSMPPPGKDTWPGWSARVPARSISSTSRSSGTAAEWVRAGTTSRVPKSSSTAACLTLAGSRSSSCHRSRSRMESRSPSGTETRRSRSALALMRPA